MGEFPFSPGPLTKGLKPCLQCGQVTWSQQKINSKGNAWQLRVAAKKDKTPAHPFLVKRGNQTIFHYAVLYSYSYSYSSLLSSTEQPTREPGAHEGPGKKPSTSNKEPSAKSRTSHTCYSQSWKSSADNSSRTSASATASTTSPTMTQQALYIIYL